MKTLVLIFFLIISAACSREPQVVVEDGVSYELAKVREESVSGLRYDVSLFIPEDVESPVTGSLQIRFRLDKEKYSEFDRESLFVDYKGPQTSIHQLKLNGKEIPLKILNEHIVVPLSEIQDESNTLCFILDFEDLSMNRNEDFLYTLLVPDRARTLMPCFDQPNLKARFSVVMTVPEGWEAMTNSPLQKSTQETLDGRVYQRMQFGTSEPLSTYLFAFVAGRFYVSEHEKGDRVIHIYHRETDPNSVGQLDEIARQVFAALDWMEEYTGIKYPFVKYDMALIPGFQFGGMEHTGATLYNAASLFLPKNPTLQHEIRRATLIAHETAHMWFGDYVTMEWFNEVWVKEVFANYFAMQMIRPLYPDMDFKLNDLTFYTRAYEEDRTAGTNPIQQELPNLKYAGLVYGNIIYQKSPIVMDMLCKKMGPENFREGLRDYLNSHPYGNASYDDLIAALERNNDGESLREWSDYWVYGKGMPEVKLSSEESLAEIRSEASESFQQLRIDEIDGHRIPNADAEFYGYISMEKESLVYIMAHLSELSERISKNSQLSSALVRKSLHMTLYENWLHGNIADIDYLRFLSEAMKSETDAQVFPYLPAAISKVVAMSREKGDFTSLRSMAEQLLWHYFGEGGKYAVQTLSSLLPIVSDPEILNALYRIWEEESSDLLGERNYISMSYYLAMNLPEKDRYILDTQLSRLTNPDRIAEYRFVSKAALAGTEKLDSIFHSLADPHNRAKEPWVKSVLLLMNQIDRLEYTVKYIRPGLEMLPEIQRTGDIFFPKNWAEGILFNHTSEEAHAAVEEFLAENQDILPLMRNKILQSCGPLISSL